MKDMFGNDLDNGFVLFLIGYGLVLWIGFAVTGEFMWFASIFDGEQSTEAGVIAGIVGLISAGAYLYGAFAMIGILISMFKRKKD